MMALKVDDLLQDVQKELASKEYEYLRWLILIATGALSLSFKVLIDSNFDNEPINIVVKLALAFNALGVIAGAIAVAGELHELGDYKMKLNNVKVQRRQGIPSPNIIILHTPMWLKAARRGCFIFLLLSVCSWLTFIYLV